MAIQERKIVNYHHTNNGHTTQGVVVWIDLKAHLDRLESHLISVKQHCPQSQEIGLIQEQVVDGGLDALNDILICDEHLRDAIEEQMDVEIDYKTLERSLQTIEELYPWGEFEDVFNDINERVASGGMHALDTIRKDFLL